MHFIFSILQTVGVVVGLELFLLAVIVLYTRFRLRLSVRETLRSVLRATLGVAGLETKQELMWDKMAEMQSKVIRTEKRYRRLKKTVRQLADAA